MHQAPFNLTPGPPCTAPAPGWWTAALRLVDRRGWRAAPVDKYIVCKQFILFEWIRNSNGWIRNSAQVPPPPPTPQKNRNSNTASYKLIPSKSIRLWTL